MSPRHRISATIKTKLVLAGVATVCLGGAFAPAALAINPQPLPPRVLPPTATIATPGAATATGGAATLD
jgi:hypothetical protein